MPQQSNYSEVPDSLKTKLGNAIAHGTYFQEDVREKLFEEIVTDILALLAQQRTDLLNSIEAELESLPTYDRSLFRDGYTDDPDDRRDMWEKGQVSAIIQKYREGIRP